MWEKFRNLTKVLIPKDAIAIVVIMLGLVIAIFLPELAIRLIGVCVAILGTLALFMGLSQRLKDNVESRFTPAVKPDYKISVKKDTSAKRQVIEGFQNSFDSEDVQEPSSDSDDQNEFGSNDFRIVRKHKVDPVQPAAQDEPTYGKAKVAVEQPVSGEFSDGVSSVRIIPKKKDESPIYVDASTESKKLIPENEYIKHETEIPAGKPKAGIISKPDPQELIQDIHEDHVKPASIYDAPVDTQQKAEPKFREKHLDVSLSMLIEDQPVTGQEPRKEFEYYLMRVLKIIRSVTSTRTAAFLLVNHDKREMILESYDTDFPDAITTQHKLPIGNDVASQIVLNEKPEILTEINPSHETDLIPFYTRSVGVSSFIGVPVFYNNAVIGILCADTDVTDAYDSVTVSFLGHFTKLIGALLQSYTEKYELVQASRTLQSIGIFRDILAGASPALEDICESAAEAASKVFEYTSLGICAYDSESGAWKIKAYRSRTNPVDDVINKTVELESSIIGSTITSGRTVFCSPVTNEYTRVYEGENEMAGGSFAAVPLKSMANNYGALFVEGKSSTSITAYDISILETLGENAGISIAQYYCMNMLEHSAIFDNSTGTLNPTAFARRLEEELAKSSDFSSPLCLCLFQIDNYASLNSEEHLERAEKALYHILDIVRRNLRPYDIFGSVNGSTFGIALVGMNLKDAQLWAERLRIEVARSVIEIRNRKFAVTISIGISMASGEDKLVDLFANAKKVLDISLNKMNSVSVFA